MNTYSLLGAPGHCGSWIAMEQAGAVFIPAVGFRRGDVPNVQSVRYEQNWVTQMCSDWKYYSIIPDGRSYNIWNVYQNYIGYNYFGFTSNNTTGSFNNGVLHAGRSVRLVRLELP